MSTSISAVWKNMRPEDAENQPHFPDGGAAWGLWLTEVWMDKRLPKAFFWSRLFSLLTCSTEGVKASDVNWVKPKKLIKCAERLKKRLNDNSVFIKKILELYEKNAVGGASPAVEFAHELDSIVEIARFVESVGGSRMTFELRG